MDALTNGAYTMSALVAIPTVLISAAFAGALSEGLVHKLRAIIVTYAVWIACTFPFFGHPGPNAKSLVIQLAPLLLFVGGAWINNTSK